MNLVQNDYHTIPTDHNGNEDWSRSNNGGNYGFGTNELHHPDGRVLDLHYCSFEGGYCEITERFTETDYVKVSGTDINVSVSKDYTREWDNENEEVIFIEEMTFDELYELQN